MVQVWNFLKGKKTYIASAVAIGLVALEHAGITIPGVQINDNAVILAVLGSTIRHGIG